GQQLQVHHGVTILATGGVEYHGPEYLYGQHPRVMSQQEFEAMLAAAEGIAETSQAHRKGLPDQVVMILCVGPAEEYCSRICCTMALKNALVLKRLKPTAEVMILYRDIRTCGFKERLYTRARQTGVRFIHYDFDRKPEVMGEGDRLKVVVWEEALGQSLQFAPDLLVLSNPVVPAEGVHVLSKRLKLPLDGNGFFMEAHVKLRPVEFSSDGFFMAGTASYPKSLDETIVEALAASARAATVLAQDSIQVGGSVAVVDASRCVACLTCVRTCPYHAPRIVPDLIGVGGIRGAAQIEAAVCHGCGSCAVACPARAIELAHYTDFQVQAKVDALFGDVKAGEPVPPMR
ncbi:MAG: 4Fe-4S binding protein, partial [Anaerolineae bacterium]|nr:4Fe-4S binding protein [Anaerolineae bacterium]